MLKWEIFTARRKKQYRDPVAKIGLVDIKGNTYRDGAESARERGGRCCWVESSDWIANSAEYLEIVLKSVIPDNTPM